MEYLVRLGLLLVAGLGIATVLSASLPLTRDWPVAFYIPLGLGGIGGLAVWSVILGVVRRRRGLRTSASQTITPLALFAGTLSFFSGRLPAGVSVIIVAAGAVTLSGILFQAGPFLGLDRDPRW